MNGLQVTNNYLVNQPVGTVPGTYSSNLSGDPKVTKSGNRPTPYYMPLQGSPLIDAGLNVGLHIRVQHPISAHMNTVQG